MSRRVLFAVFCAVAAAAPAWAQDIFFKETRSYDREGFRNEFKKDPDPPTAQAWIDRHRSQYRRIAANGSWWVYERS